MELTNECVELLDEGLGVSYDPVLNDNIVNWGGRFDVHTTNLKRVVQLLNDVVFSGRVDEERVYDNYLETMVSLQQLLQHNNNNMAN